MRPVSVMLLAAALAAAAASPAPARVKAVSTDGEATIYATGDFSAEFDVAYKVVFRPNSSNRSWTSISVLLLGRKGPGYISIGLFGGYPKAGETSAFVTYAAGSRRAKFSTIRNDSPRPVLELRGDETHLYAYLNGVRIASWLRSVYRIERPYLQINGEVAASGDVIDARLTPVRLIASRHALHYPTCAFTTQGVTPSANRDGVLIISGARRISARATFIRLADGAPVERC